MLQKITLESSPKWDQAEWKIVGSNNSFSVLLIDDEGEVRLTIKNISGELLNKLQKAITENKV